MRRILVELEQNGQGQLAHTRCANRFGMDIADIVGEADVYTPHTKIFKTPDGLRHAYIIIISTYVRTLEHEKAVVELIDKKRVEFKLPEIRFNVVDCND